MRLARYGVLFACAVTLAGRAVAGEEPVKPGTFEPDQDIPALVRAAQDDPRGPYSPLSEASQLELRAFARDLMTSTASDPSGVLEVLGDSAGDGQGLMIVRTGGESLPVVLQAPHSFSDIGTGQLAAEIMARSDFRVLLVNTRHRRAVEVPEGRHPASDVAHRADSAFHALTLGALDGLERPLLVQLHGFGRQTVEDAAVDVVASCGATDHRAVLDAFAASLRAGLPQLGVARYPDDISLLGGTTNVQGRALAGRADAAFLHLELSPEARKLVLDSVPAQDALRASIEEAAAALQ